MAEHRGPGSSFCVATVNFWEDGAGHNSSLIAAAPELLDALIVARKTLATALIANAGGLFDDESVGEHVTVAQIDAALAKARGQ